MEKNNQERGLYVFSLTFQMLTSLPLHNQFTNIKGENIVEREVWYRRQTPSLTFTGWLSQLEQLLNFSWTQFPQLSHGKSSLLG